MFDIRRFLKRININKLMAETRAMMESGLVPAGHISETLSMPDCELEVSFPQGLSGSVVVITCDNQSHPTAMLNVEHFDGLHDCLAQLGEAFAVHQAPEAMPRQIWELPECRLELAGPAGSDGPLGVLSCDNPTHGPAELVNGQAFTSKTERETALEKLLLRHLPSAS